MKSERAKVLLVDDRPANLLALEASLEELDVELIRAGSGEEALRHVLSDNFAAILLDVQMPGMDGFETARMIRGREATRRTPILFLTAYDSTGSQSSKGYELGAVDYIMKPLVPEILRSKVSVFVDLHLKTLEAERRAAALKESNETLESFAYSVSHDLQAPLRSLEGLSKLLLSNGQTGANNAQADTLNRIADAAKRMRQMITDLLEYSRLGRDIDADDKVELSVCLAEAEATVEPRLKESSGTLVVEGALPAVSGHGPTLTRVLQNLLDNAVKFVEAGRSPHVRVGAEENGEMRRLWIEDNGIGIAAEDQDRLFKVFERLHPPGRYPGTGIGLAIVKKAVERMGGSVGFSSEPGHGSRFWIELPRGAGKASLPVGAAEGRAT